MGLSNALCELRLCTYNCDNDKKHGRVDAHSSLPWWREVVVNEASRGLVHNLPYPSAFQQPEVGACHLEPMGFEYLDAKLKSDARSSLQDPGVKERARVARCNAESQDSTRLNQLVAASTSASAAVAEASGARLPSTVLQLDNNKSVGVVIFPEANHAAPEGKKWDTDAGKYVQCDQSQSSNKKFKSRATSIGNTPFVPPSSPADMQLAVICTHEVRGAKQGMSRQLWDAAVETYNAAVYLAVAEGNAQGYTGPTSRELMKGSIGGWNSSCSQLLQEMCSQ